MKVTRKTKEPSGNWTLRFSELHKSAIGIAGGKGANLGEMFNAGLPVPPGFVVGACAYAAHIAEAGLAPRIRHRLADITTEDIKTVEDAAADIRAWILSAPIPDVIAEAVAGAYARLGEATPRPKSGGARTSTETSTEDRRVAVRSSATAEDLPDASFAGQQETYLNVQGQAELLTAVRKCWASLWESRAVHYRLRMGYDHLAVSLAVVVQVMVPAETAGVLFTANPMTGSNREFVVTASYGLGEAVVSGLVTPDTFVLSANGKTRTRQLGSKEKQVVATRFGTEVIETAPKDRIRYCLTKLELSALADLGRHVMSHYGAPQDIEWAFAQGRLYVLQSRPITTPLSADNAPAARTLGERVLARRMVTDLTDHFPEPLKPMDFAILCNAMDGILALTKDIGFKPASAVTFVAELPDGRIAFRPKLPKPSIRLLWALPHRIFRAAFDDPMASWLPVSGELMRDIDQKSRADLNTMGAAGLADHITEILAGLDRYMPVRFQKIFFCGALHEWLVRFWTRWAVGRTRASIVIRQLYLAVPYSTARMNLDIARLTQAASRSGMESPEFQTALGDFIRTWGHNPVRGMVNVPSVPSWRENPDAVLGLVRALLADTQRQMPESTECRQKAEFAAARDEINAHLIAPNARLFNASLVRARNYIVAREDGFAPHGMAVIRLRQSLIRLGDLLCQNNVLDDRDDIFFLLHTELLQAVGGKIPDIRVRVARRRRGFHNVQTAWSNGVNWFVASGSIPAQESASTAHDGDGLLGIGASQGLAAGPVCVVHNQSEFGIVRKGDILVAPATAPPWTPLFGLVAGVVTEIGGPLSHAAIVAREYGIPAVLAVSHATTLLQDGERVIVDGAAGRVRRDRAGGESKDG